jgi:hypothetical protein
VGVAYKKNDQSTELSSTATSWEVLGSFLGRRPVILIELFVLSISFFFDVQFL